MRTYIIAENGESDFHIVANQYSDEAVRYAASELQKYLLKSTGAVVPYFSDRCPSRGPEIRIGPNVRGETVNADDLCEEGFRIVGKDENIYIVGNTSRGVIYGVYYFLETFCGFACYTKDAEKIDRHPRLEIELDEIVQEPAFEFRDAYFRFAFDGDFCVKNRLNTSLADLSVGKGGRMKWYNFHHSFRDLVSPDIYFDTHPEYFSEIDGERVKDSQLCLTNPEVLKIAEQTLRRWIKENPECRVFSVAQNDNRKKCNCPACLALEEEEGSPAGPIIHFVNKLADAIKDEYPHILLHTFAYQYSLPAPRYAVARDNVIVRLCSIACRFDKPLVTLAERGAEKEIVYVNALRDWASHAKRLYVWDYIVNFRNYLQPFFPPHTLQANLQMYKSIGIMGILEQGNFAYGGGGSFDEMKSYLIAKLLWNPDADVDAAIHDYCYNVYGEKAGAIMEEYARYVADACQSHPMTIYQNPAASYITDEFVDTVEAMFEKALDAAENDVYRRRVEREQLSVRFLRLARMPLETPGRPELVDQFFEDVKSHGITEIRERRTLAAAKEAMLTSLYLTERPGHLLYYIMQ